MQELSIRDILTGRPPITVPPTASVVQACAMMDRHEVGALGIVEDGRLEGMLSDRDVIRRCIATGRDPTTTPVRSIMTARPASVAPEERLMDALDLMQGFGFRHLPVVGLDGDLVGMVSRRDIPREFRMAADWRPSARPELRPS